MWLIKIFSEILWMVPSKISSGYLTLSIPLLDISKNFHNSYHYPFLIFYLILHFLFSKSGHEVGKLYKIFLFDKNSHGKSFSFFPFFDESTYRKVTYRSAWGVESCENFIFHFLHFSREFGLCYVKIKLQLNSVTVNIRDLEAWLPFNHSLQNYPARNLPL